MRIQITVIVLSIFLILISGCQCIRPQKESLTRSTSKSLNLARTNLASVKASSVNGQRSQANCFYGILNVFDDGKNIVNGINYTYWIPDPGENHWIEVYFSHPVTVNRILVVGTKPSIITVYNKDNAEESYIPQEREYLFDGEQRGVIKIKFMFTNRQTKVYEIKVMGQASGIKCIETVPRIDFGKKEIQIAAKEIYRDWLRNKMKAKVASIQEDEKSFSVIMTAGDVKILKITIDKKNATHKLEELFTIKNK